MKPAKVIWASTLVIIPGISKYDYNKEIGFQIYCADWLRKQFELTGNELYSRWHHSANERSSGSEGFIAKMCGQNKGFPDFIHCGMKIAIELKVMGRMPSKEQVEWLLYFKSIKWHTGLFYTFEDFKQNVSRAIARQK